MNSDGPTLLLRPQSTRHTMHDMHEDFHNLYANLNLTLAVCMLLLVTKTLWLFLGASWASRLVGNESHKDHRLLLSMMLASLSGFLIFPAWNASDSEAEIYGMAFAMLAQLLTMARWVFVNAVLPKVHPASDRFAATIVLAANVAVVASTALLELTTVLDFRGQIGLTCLNAGGGQRWGCCTFIP